LQSRVTLSAESTPDDRRVLASLMFLGAMRFGEAASLTRRDYGQTCEALGKLVIEKSYRTKKRKVKGARPRTQPQAATGGPDRAPRGAGRTATPTRACAVPRGPGAHRSPARRQHDARRTFISIARADGAVADTPHFASQAPTATSWTSTRRCRGRRCAPR